MDLGWIAGYALLAVGVSWSVKPLPEGTEPSHEQSAVAGTMVMFGMLDRGRFPAPVRGGRRHHDARRRTLC